MIRSPGIERARVDLEAGRLWKARDRLHGLFHSDPADQEVLGLLGEVLFRMGDHPQAGRYWYLTERVGEDAEIAAEAFAERFGRTSGDVAHVLPVRAGLADYPEGVRARLEMLASELPSWWPGTHTKWADEASTEPNRWFEGLRIVVALVLTFGVWLVGVVALLVWIFEGGAGPGVGSRSALWNRIRPWSGRGWGVDLVPDLLSM